jgi:HTH-type transcriptional regulator / antitoxin HigA
LVNLEANYQETRARLAEQVELEKDLDWLKRIPLGEMVKRGWLKKHRDKRDQLKEVLRFFGIASVAQWQEIWPEVAVAYRQHGKQQIFPEAISAWLRQGEIEAAAIDCQPYEKARFRAVLDKARGLASEPDPSEVCACAARAVRKCRRGGRSGARTAQDGPERRHPLAKPRQGANPAQPALQEQRPSLVYVLP